MRIVILGTRGFPNVQGGVEKHCECLATQLAQLGCEVIVFTRKPYVDQNIQEFKGVRLVALPALRHKSLEAFLHTLCGVFAAVRYRPDVLHLQAIGPAFFTPLAKLLGMRVVVTTHGSNYKHQKWGWFAKMVLRFSEFAGVMCADKVIAVSETIAREITQKYRRTAQVIPNGVMPSEEPAGDTILQRYNLTKKKYILAVGRFVPEKGFHDLIQAFSALHLHEWKLVIAGQADHEDAYSLGLKDAARKVDTIVLTGFLDGTRLHEIYSHAGLFVLPSYYEGLPLVLLEAMSYGLTCIASDIPANRSVKLSDECYVKPGSITGLRKKIAEFSEKPLSEEEAQNQRKRIRSDYNWNTVARQTRTVYEQVILSNE